MNVIVIGAGAAGLTAAIKAAQKGAKVTVLEGENKPGKKILVTGNGKCNITNTSMSIDKYYGNKEFLETILAKFDATCTLDFFHNLGIATKDKNGYIYPASEQAATVLNTLRDTAINLGVSIKTNNKIDKIQRKDNGFDIHIGIILHCDKIIIATGGMSYSKNGFAKEGYRLAESLGHHIINPQPALTALICETNSLFKASGTRVKAGLTVKKSEKILGRDEGELQITDYGISGIPVFNISRLTDAGSKIIIDFMLDYDYQHTVNIIYDILQKRSFMSVLQALNGCMNEKLANAILERININKTRKAYSLSEEEMKQLIHHIKEYSLTVKSRRGFDFAQITQGGVNTSEIDAATMESKIVNGLYFAGEILDVDGICGGYNLQFAWATGAIAGGSCHE